MPLRLLVLALALTACGGDRVSTAGAYDDDSGGASTAGTVGDAPTPGDAADALYPDLSGAALLDRIDRDFSPARTLGYDRARDVLYAHEQAVHGAVCGVYSGFCIRLNGGDPSFEAQALRINAEHVWPQSMGAEAEPLKSDLHHLFPARDNVNSSRGNRPFGEIDDDATEAWYLGDRSQSRPPRTDVDAWSERGPGLFEPREAVQGDVARAVFYAVATYPEVVEPAYFATMREALLAWNRADPPDAAERARSAWVATLQGTENPFVRDLSLADRIWAGGPLRPADAPRAPAGALSITELHYDNDGADDGEGVEVSGPPGVSLEGWRLVLYNGDGGAAYGEVALRGTVPPSGARWVGRPGLQNGPADGIALVGPDGVAAEFWSYEGTLRASDGPAQGQRSTDVGVAQGGSTPPGRSLQRTAAGWRLGPASPGR
ncbi:endonuclease [Rubrivirga sp. IMCC45206]|uniref:endonuclease n=1 Tax=Rubrivirga sp. IMCC45206 TaxID=3391614 RepID=UPI00398FBF84